MLTFSPLSLSGGLGGDLVSAFHAFWSFGVPFLLASSPLQVVDTCSQACFFSPARFCRICPDRRVVLALCFRSASAVKAVGVDGSATQPLFPRHLRPLSFCGTTVSSLLRRQRRTPLGGRGAWRSGPSSSSLLLFPLSLSWWESTLLDSTEIEYPHLGERRTEEIYFRR